MASLTPEATAAPPPAATTTPQSDVGDPEHTLSRWQRLQPPVILAGVLVVASLALHLRDPHQQGSWGFCPWLLVTGTYCPGCGGLRAVNDLTDGDIVAAASSNLLLVGALPVVAGLWLRSLHQRWRGVTRRWPARRVNAAWAVAVVAMAAYWVVRNLPVDAVAWLTP